MHYDASLAKKCLLSIFAILASFLGFAGISLFADLVAGAHPGTAFQHKLFFLVMISLGQFGIVIGDPVNSKIRVWLRIFVVAGLGMSCAWLFGSELAALRLIDPMTNRLMMLSAFILLLTTGTLFHRKLGNRLHADDARSR
jgi:hypothetical protein